MKDIDVILNAIVEEGFTATIYFIPISIVTLSIFKLYGILLILGFIVSVIITTAFFVTRLHLRLKGKSVNEKNVKEAVLVGTITSATFTVYTAAYSAIVKSNFVCFALAFITYLMWRYYESLEGPVNLKRVVRLCMYVSTFNVVIGLIYALKGLSFTIWLSCWIGLIFALIVLEKLYFNDNRSLH